MKLNLIRNKALNNTFEQIKQILDREFTGSIHVIDDSHLHIGHANEGAGHYTIHIVDEKFNDLSRIKRHKLIYDLLKSSDLKIHALAMRLYTPYEYYSK